MGGLQILQMFTVGILGFAKTSVRRLDSWRVFWSIYCLFMLTLFSVSILQNFLSFNNFTEVMFVLGGWRAFLAMSNICK
jgi:hypothetical protein